MEILTASEDEPLPDAIRAPDASDIFEACGPSTHFYVPDFLPNMIAGAIHP